MVLKGFLRATHALQNALGCHPDLSGGAGAGKGSTPSTSATMKKEKNSDKLTTDNRGKIKGKESAVDNKPVVPQSAPNRHHRVSARGGGSGSGGGTISLEPLLSSIETVLVRNCTRWISILP